MQKLILVLITKSLFLVMHNTSCVNSCATLMQEDFMQKIKGPEHPGLVLILRV